MTESLRMRTKVFDLSFQGYRNLSELAGAMGISVSQVYRVREGKRQINQKFIIGALKAFPGYRLDDLFYLAPDENKRFRDMRSGSQGVDIYRPAPVE
jgi:transcriptional regulator with XRE-family HTH domain